MCAGERKKCNFKQDFRNGKPPNTSKAIFFITAKKNSKAFSVRRAREWCSFYFHFNMYRSSFAIFMFILFFLILAMDLYPTRGAYHTRVCNINGFILFFRRQFFEWLLGPKHTILSLFFKRYKTLVIMVYVLTHVIYIFFSAKVRVAQKKNVD